MRGEQVVQVEQRGHFAADLGQRLERLGVVPLLREQPALTSAVATCAANWRRIATSRSEYQSRLAAEHVQHADGLRLLQKRHGQRRLHVGHDGHVVAGRPSTSPMTTGCCVTRSRGRAGLRPSASRGPEAVLGIPHRVGQRHALSLLADEVDAQTRRTAPAGGRARESGGSSSSRSMTDATFRPSSKSVSSMSRSAPDKGGRRRDVWRLGHANGRGEALPGIILSSDDLAASPRLRGDRTDPAPPLPVSARRSGHRLRARPPHRRHQECLAQRAVPVARRRASGRCCRRRF